MVSLFSDLDSVADREAYIIARCDLGMRLLDQYMIDGDLDALLNVQKQALRLAKRGGSARIPRSAHNAVMLFSRHCDRALGLAVRKAQDDGRVRRSPVRTPENHERSSPRQWLGAGNSRLEIYALIDGVTELEFENALAEAAKDGNLSRRNVIRKIRYAGFSPDWIPSPDDHTLHAAQRRRELIREMAGEGLDSRAMQKRIGTLDTTIRQIARELDIEIPADKITARTRLHRSDQIVEELITTLAGTAMSMELVDVSDLDPAKTDGWVKSLTASTRIINAKVREIRERRPE